MGHTWIKGLGSWHKTGSMVTFQQEICLTRSFKRGAGKIIGMKNLLQITLAGLFFFSVAAPDLWAGSALPLELRMKKAVAAGDYLCASIQKNGRFLYEYNPLECKESEGYDWSHHWGATLALIRLFDATNNAKFLDAAKRTAKTAMDRAINLSIDGQKFRVFADIPGSQTTTGKVDTEECAMGLMALVQLDKAGQAPVHKEDILALRRYLRHIQYENGSFPGWYAFHGQKGQFIGLRSRKCQGQVLAALALTQDRYPDPNALPGINRLVNYLAREWELEDHEEHQESFDYWGMIGFGASYRFVEDRGLTTAHEETLQSLKTELGEIQSWQERNLLFDERRALDKRLNRTMSKLALIQDQPPLNRASLIPLVFTYCNNELKGQILEPGRTEHGSFWKAQGVSAAAAARLEGLEAVHDLIVNTPGTPYQEWIRRWEPRLDLVRAFIVQCQYTKQDMEEFACPLSLAGAFRRKINESRGKPVRLDYCWHGVFSLLGWNIQESQPKIG